MNILLTNDDGISSEGIQKLASALRSNGKYRVTVLAPDTDRSGVSHSLSIFTKPVSITPLGEDNWSCSGTPADCVIIAQHGVLSVKPDIVISGINRGANSGTDIVYSGTAAAARQGSLGGLPAIAFSLSGKSPFYWDMAASWSAEHLEELLMYWKENAFVNVNIPNSPTGPLGLAVTWPALKSYHDSISVVSSYDGSSWCFFDPGKDVLMDEAGSDCDILLKNLVSVSSLYNYPVALGHLNPGVSSRVAVPEREN